MDLNRPKCVYIYSIEVRFRCYPPGNVYPTIHDMVIVRGTIFDLRSTNDVKMMDHRLELEETYRKRLLKTRFEISQPWFVVILSFNCQHVSYMFCCGFEPKKKKN